VATKFPTLTGRFLEAHHIPHTLISAEGTLETAPTIGYADLIADLVSSGQTLRDNRLRPLEGGTIQPSQAVLIANRNSLEHNPQARMVANQLLESIEAHLRARENVLITANVRGASPEAVAAKIHQQPTIRGLQGPTITRVYVQDGNPNWFAINIVVRRAHLHRAIAELREIGGSGVIVSPVTYIFEEEPARVRALAEILNRPGERPPCP